MVKCVLGEQPAVWIKNKKDPWLNTYAWWAKFRNLTSGSYVLEAEDQEGVRDRIRIRIEVVEDGQQAAPARKDRAR